MKVTKELKVSNEEFYEALYHSLKSEIELTVGKEIPKLYQGYKFEKELVTYAKSKRKVKVVVDTLIPNEKYVGKFSNNDDINTVEFFIKPITDTKCEVTYEENYKSEKNSREMNYSLVTFFITPLNKRKAKKKLKAIEKYIINNR